MLYFCPSNRRLTESGTQGFWKKHNSLPHQHLTLQRSYLEGRTFLVRCGEAKSSIRSVNAGVPQGSVLGPILYTIYTSNLPIISDERLTVATFADDTTFMATAETEMSVSEIIHTQLDTIEPWLRRWNITVNEDKSTQSTFSLSRGDCPPVSLNGVSIPVEPMPKYLWMTLDRRKRKQAEEQIRQYYWLIGRQ